MSMAIIYYLTRVIQCYYFREHRSSTIWRQNRHILRKLHNSKDVVFGKFIKRLSKTQPGVSKRIQAVQGQFRLYRKDKRSTSEDDFASDFDPGNSLKKTFTFMRSCSYTATLYIL